MSDSEPSIDADASISEKMDRVYEIIETIEDGEVSLERAKHLRDEGRTILETVEEDIDLGDSTILERE
jgi:exonuclease VII small subunit